MAELTATDQTATDPGVSSSCCSSEAQSTCCQPSEKSDCCGPEATAAGGCGCSAGDAPASADVRETVREKYAAAARQVAGQGSSCCDPVALTDGDQTEVFGSTLYDGAEAEGATASAVAASLGCGVPTAVADLHEGETVLDLGSGAGADVLISAGRVGPSGRAIGLDMTDEMLELARANAAEAGVENVEFVKGYIEEIPLPDGSVDVIVSNCVLNLSGDKPRVLAEAARVLKPGGRFAISDVIASPDMDAETRADMAAYTGCIAGALTEQEFRDGLASAGLIDVEISPTHKVHEHATSAIIRARKAASAVMATVLFVCLHNAGRSQMSAALFARAADGRHHALSAGSEADPNGRVHPPVVEVMRELGIDLSDRRPQPLTDELAAQADVVVTMGCGDACPFIPGKRYIDWELPDPKDRPLDEVRETRDQIANLVGRLVDELDHAAVA